MATESHSQTPSSQGPALPGKASKPFDVLRFLFQRGLYVALFGTILFAPTLPFAVMKMYTVYQIAARIQFEREPLSAMGTEPSQAIAYYFQDYVRTQTKLLKEQTFLKGVLEKLDRRRWMEVLLPLTNNCDAAAGRLSGLLNVGFDNGTQFMTVTMETLSAKGSAETLNAVMDAFVERKIREQFATTERNMAYLKVQRDKLQAEIDREQRVADEAAREATTSSFLEDNNTWRSLYEQTRNELTKAQVISLEKGWRLVAESNRVSSARTVSLQSLVDEMTAGDQSLWGVTLWTYQTLQELRKSVDGVSSTNPDRRYTDERMQALDDFAKNFRKEIELRNQRIITDKRDYELEAALRTAEAEALAARMTERDLNAMADDVKRKMVETSSVLWRGRSAETRLEKMSAQRDIFDSRLRVLEAERNAAPRVAVAVYAVTPGSGAVKFPMKLLAALFLMSYGLVAGLYGAYALLDNRIRSAKDVEAALGAEGVKPLRLVTPPARYFGILGKQPFHPVSSALRLLAYRLEREHRVNGTRVFLFTGVGPQCGVTDTLLNVAIALRRMSLNVAVLDMNVASPACAKRYGLEEGDFIPINRFLWGGLEPYTACRVEGRNGLPDLYAAREEKEGQPLAGRSLFNLFDALRERYDILLVDSEPISHSEFTVFVAQQADAAVLLVREDESLYRDLRLAMQVVSTAGVGSMAAVLNFDVARNPIGSLIGQIQKVIGLTSLSVRLAHQQRALFRENYKAAGERRLLLPLVRWHVREFGARWVKEAERIIRK